MSTLNDVTPSEWDHLMPKGPKKQKEAYPTSSSVDYRRGTDEARAIDVQVGGSHYKDLPIQPIEYIVKNGLGFCEGNIVKYITRYREKGGVEDLDKVIHYAQLLKELQYEN